MPLNLQYLVLTLTDPSTTSTTKLPPVRAHPVYHPRVKPKTSVPTRPTHHHLHGLDAGWCSDPGPHRKGTRSWARQTADRHTQQGGSCSRLARGQDVGTDSRLQLTGPLCPTSGRPRACSCCGPMSRHRFLPLLFEQGTTLVIPVTQRLLSCSERVAIVTRGML
jgi:hypothetical protein